MKLQRRSVDPDHVTVLGALQVRPDQRDLVTANASTLQEVQVAPGGHVWGLWVGDVPVGLIAGGPQPRQPPRPGGPFHPRQVTE